MQRLCVTDWILAAWLVYSTLETLESCDRPGRYPLLRGRHGDDCCHNNWNEIAGWYGVRSARHSLPWIQDHPEFSREELRAALRLTPWTRAFYASRILKSAAGYERDRRLAKAPRDDADHY